MDIVSQAHRIMLVVHFGRRRGTHGAKAAMTEFPRVQLRGRPTALNTTDSCLSTG